MAKDKTKKRLRKLRKQVKRQGRKLQSLGRGPGSRPFYPESPMPPWEAGPGDDLEGGAGVREPRHPFPTMPAAALELDEPRPLYLDLTR